MFSMSTWVCFVCMYYLIEKKKHFCSTSGSFETSSQFMNYSCEIVIIMNYPLSKQRPLCNTPFYSHIPYIHRFATWIVYINYRTAFLFHIYIYIRIISLIWLHYHKVYSSCRSRFNLNVVVLSFPPISVSSFSTNFKYTSIVLETIFISPPVSLLNCWRSRLSALRWNVSPYSSVICPLIVDLFGQEWLVTNSFIR